MSFLSKLRSFFGGSEAPTSQVETDPPVYTPAPTYVPAEVPATTVVLDKPTVGARLENLEHKFITKVDDVVTKVGDGAKSAEVATKKEFETVKAKVETKVDDVKAKVTPKVEATKLKVESKVAGAKSKYYDKKATVKAKAATKVSAPRKTVAK